MSLQTILERLSAFLDGNFVPKASLDAISAELETRNTELGTRNADLITAKASLKTLGESLSARDAELKLTQTELATLSAANTELGTRNAELTTRLSDPKGEIGTRLAATLASHGVPAAAVPDLSKAGGSLDRASAQKNYDQLVADKKPMEAGQYYQTHKALLS